jgi:DnaK suppressor protein
MLSEKEKKQIRVVLEDEQKRLAKTSQNALAYSMNHERNIGRDSIDESMEEEIFSTELRLRDREKFLLGKIDEALRRVEEGTIDHCEDCGESIGFKRLLARPVTTYCIDCKEEREKEEQSQATQAGGRGAVSREDMAGEELTGGTED